MLSRAAIGASLVAGAVVLSAAPLAADGKVPSANDRTVEHPHCTGGTLAGQDVTIVGNGDSAYLADGTHVRVVRFHGTSDGEVLDKKSGELVPVHDEFEWTKNATGSITCVGTESFSDPETGEHITFGFDVTATPIQG